MLVEVVEGLVAWDYLEVGTEKYNKTYLNNSEDNSFVNNTVEFFVIDNKK